MDQDTVKDALSEQLDVIEKSLFWALAIAVVVGWAGYHHATDTIELAGIKTNKSDTYYVASLAFILANLAILMALLRMGDLLTLLEDADFKKGLERVMTHASLFNPFAFFGSGPLAEIYNSLGWGLLIFCWWICYTSISTLINFAKVKSILQSCLFMVGILSVLAMHRFQAAMLGRLHKMDSAYARTLAKTSKIRSIIGAIAGLLGALMFFQVQWKLWRG